MGAGFMNLICFWHRSDLDGCCSAAIVKHFPELAKAVKKVEEAAKKYVKGDRTQGLLFKVA